MASRVPPLAAGGDDERQEQERIEKDRPGWESCALDTRCALLDYWQCYCYDELLRDFLPECDV